MEMHLKHWLFLAFEASCLSITCTHSDQKNPTIPHTDLFIPPPVLQLSGLPRVPVVADAGVVVAPDRRGLVEVRGCQV